MSVEYRHQKKKATIFYRADSRKEAEKMKGYYIADGYMGLIDGTYRLFADETDYIESLEA